MNNNKPAYPTPFIPGRDACDDQPPREGMTLREWYAGQALAGLCANPKLIGGIEEFMQCSTSILNGLSQKAFCIADKMVEEKQQ